MKSVMISIKPKWCELIASGKKTVEVRKTRPTIEAPFKCYIYETRNRRAVIGEFICDQVLPISVEYSNPEHKTALTEFPLLTEFPYIGLTDKQIMDYLGDGKEGYGWHISELVIYDKPKWLGEFRKPLRCHSGKNPGGRAGYEDRIIKSSPQSWCYCEEAVAKVGESSPRNPIEKKQKEVERYNARHGTRLNYGEYVALERMGKL